MKLLRPYKDKDSFVRLLDHLIHVRRPVKSTIEVDPEEFTLMDYWEWSAIQLEVRQGQGSVRGEAIESLTLERVCHHVLIPTLRRHVVQIVLHRREIDLS